jgi:hypothetical protein
VKNGNVADALSKLQYTLQRNRVVSELRLAARHEKKGYKRRRLNSQRWRRRFAHEVWASLSGVTYQDQRFLGAEKGSTCEPDTCSRRVDLSLPSRLSCLAFYRVITLYPRCCALHQMRLLLRTGRQNEFFITLINTEK